MARLTAQELEQIGTTRTHREDEESVLAYRTRLEKRVLIPLQVKPYSAADNYNPVSAQRSAKQKLILNNRVFSTVFLTRYLVTPLWETISELWCGKRIRTNIAKIILSVLTLAAIIITLIYFPPLVAVFAAINLPTAVTLVGGATLALLIVVQKIEEQAQKGHGNAYECMLLQEHFWKKEYGVPNELSQKIKAYLLNQFFHSSNETLKNLFQKLLFQLEIGTEEEVNGIAVFFIKELAILEKYPKPCRDYEWVLEIVQGLNNAKNIPFPTKARLSRVVGRLAIDQWKTKIDTQFENLNQLLKDSPDNIIVLELCYQNVQKTLKGLEISLKNEKIKLEIGSAKLQKVVFSQNKDYRTLNQYLTHLDEKR